MAQTALNDSNHQGRSFVVCTHVEGKTPEAEVRICRSVSPTLLSGHRALDSQWDAIRQRSEQVLADHMKRGADFSRSCEAVVPLGGVIFDPDDCEDMAAQMLKTVGVDLRFSGAELCPSILAACNVKYHVDVQGWINDAFLIWVLKGPAKQLRLAGGGSVVMQEGDYALFDPCWPHALTRVGQEVPHQDAATSADDVWIFLCLEIRLEQSVRDRLGIQGRSEHGFSKPAFIDSPNVSVDEETGAFSIIEVSEQ